MYIQSLDPSKNEWAVAPTLSREERCDQYRALARAILELAWRDASPHAACSEAERREARAFMFSEEADFWAYVAGVNLAQIRRLLRRYDETSQN